MTKMTDAKAILSVAKIPLEVVHERVDPDAFDGLSVAMQGVEFAAALRIPEMSPVGGLVAGAGKARLLDEGFEQDRPIGVAGMPVGGQSHSGQGEDARGEVFAVDPRQDEEASGVYGLNNRRGSSSSRLAHCPIALRAWTPEAEGFSR